MRIVEQFRKRGNSPSIAWVKFFLLSYIAWRETPKEWDLAGYLFLGWMIIGAAGYFILSIFGEEYE